MVCQYEYLYTDSYAGFECTGFTLNGRGTLVVRPKKALEGNPTVWRVEYPYAYDFVDREMLRRGWHLCYHNVSDMYGCDESLEIMHNFHVFAHQTFGISEKAVMFGFSSGGLYSVNYAAKYPDAVSGLYLGAPLLDIRSWPCDDLESEDAERCLELYKLTPETLKDFHQNPLDKADAVAKIPTVIVAGDADTVVPYAENGALFAKKLAERGGLVKTIVKPGCNHHPHSLEDPTPVADFISEHCNG